MKSGPGFILGILILSGCAKTQLNTAVVIAPAHNDTVTYLALGDSYTIGEAVSQSQSFPYQLKDFLIGSSYYVAPPTIIATTGWTSGDLIYGINQRNINTDNYDFVTLLIGVNDQYVRVSQNIYHTNFAQLLNTAIGYAKGNKNHVFVLSIPDYGVTPFANGNDAVIGPQIDQFNAINKAISDSAGVNYVNITPISRQAANDPRLIASDGLHPSAIMYSMWVQLLGPVVAEQLRK